MKDIKDVGFGLIDRHTVIGVMFTMVLSQVLFGFQIPVDTTSASQLFIDIIILTGYLFLARSIYRLPVAAVASLTIIRTVLFRRTLELAKDGDRYGTWSDSKLKRIIAWILLISVSLIAGLIFFPLLISSFSTWAEEGKLPPVLEKFNKGFRRNILEMLDRAGIVLIAILATIPSFYPYVKWLGVLGISLMVIVFVLRGHFTALIRDVIEKEITEKQEKKQKDESNTLADQAVKGERTSHISQTTTRNGTYCKVCGKFCAPNGKGHLPKYCSLECRQKGYVLWDKDWCIEDGNERRLINSLRNTGYADWEQNRRVIEELGQIKTVSAVWTLLGIIHDNDHFGFHGNVKNAIKQIGGTIAIPELIEAITDDSNDVSQIAIELLGDFSEDYSTVTVGDIYLAGSLRHESVGVRRTAIDTLEKVGGSIAIRALLGHLGKGEPAEDYLAIKALSRLGNNAVPALREALNHEYSWIQEEAAKALQALNESLEEPDTPPLLEKTIACINCRQDMPIQIPKGKMIQKQGKNNWVAKMLKKWDVECDCPSCGTKMGVKLKIDRIGQLVSEM